MIGAILGDIIGAPYEDCPCKDKNFPLFGIGKNRITDDSLMTMAVFCALEKCNGNYKNLEQIAAQEMVKWGNKYPSDYGINFAGWLKRSTEIIQPPYNSFGNGSAMRVSPVAYFAKSLIECMELAQAVTRMTHNHREGIIGAEATAVATWLALQGKSQEEIRKHIDTEYYPMNRTCADIIASGYRFDASCQGTVPESIQAFLEATSFEDAIRKTVMLGGDADTMGAITGAIAGAFFKISQNLIDKIFDYSIDDNIEAVIRRMIKKGIIKND